MPPNQEVMSLHPARFLLFLSSLDSVLKQVPQGDAAVWAILAELGLFSILKRSIILCYDKLGTSTRWLINIFLQ